MSSIRRMEMAASVAALNCLILDMAGSRTPALSVSLSTPLTRSSPVLQITKWRAMNSQEPRTTSTPSCQHLIETNDGRRVVLPPNQSSLSQHLRPVSLESPEENWQIQRLPTVHGRPGWWQRFPKMLPPRTQLHHLQAPLHCSPAFS